MDNPDVLNNTASVSLSCRTLGLSAEAALPSFPAVFSCVPFTAAENNGLVWPISTSFLLLYGLLLPSFYSKIAFQVRFSDDLIAKKECLSNSK